MSNSLLQESPAAPSCLFFWLCFLGIDMQLNNGLAPGDICCTRIVFDSEESKPILLWLNQKTRRPEVVSLGLVGWLDDVITRRLLPFCPAVLIGVCHTFRLCVGSRRKERGEEEAAPRDFSVHFFGWEHVSLPLLADQRQANWVFIFYRLCGRGRRGREWEKEGAQLSSGVCHLLGSQHLLVRGSSPSPAQSQPQNIVFIQRGEKLLGGVWL